MIEAALSAGAQVLVTGDIGHHAGIDAVARGMAVIDAGHYGLEHIFILWQIISAVSPEEAFRYLRQSRISRFRFIKSRNQDGK